MIGISDDLKEFLSGVKSVVAASPFEYMTLWEKWSKTHDWKSDMGGYLVTVGHIGRRPTCISVRSATIGGRKVMFYEATSMLVDHKKIEQWLEKYLGGVHKTDADNFHTVIWELKEKANAA